MNIDLWTQFDFENGLCSVDKIGKPVFPVVTPVAQIVEVEPEPEVEWSDDILENELAAYKRDPDRYRITSASNLNKLIDAQMRKMEKAERPKTAIVDMSTNQLRAMLNEGMQADDFWTLCQNGIDHLKTTKNYHDFDAFMLFLRSYVK